MDNYVHSTKVNCTKKGFKAFKQKSTHGRNKQTGPKNKMSALLNKILPFKGLEVPELLPEVTECRLAGPPLFLCRL